jgi:phosphoglycerate dehydrogenase-like enzyme
VLVTNAPIESTYIGVAETTIAMMLALLKKLILRDKFTRSGLWRNGPIQGTYIHGGIVVGLLGFGRIAREVARLLQPWRVKLITCSPHTPPEIIKQAGVTSVDFDTLLKESDVLLVLTSLTPEKRHIIGENQLMMMKRTAYLINTARGALIDEKALVRALEEKWIAGAALDCYEEEPISRDNPLLNLENVLLSPHCASFNEGVGAQVEGVKIATENVLKALRGELPSHIVNPEVIPKWKERFGQQR